MPRIQMSIKPSYNMTPNQRKMVAQRRNVDTEVETKSGKMTAFIIVGVGVLAIVAVAGFFLINNGEPRTQPAEDLTALGSPEKLDTENVSNTNVEPAAKEQVNQKVDNKQAPHDEIVNKRPVETDETVKINFDSIKPNTGFAQQFFESVIYIEPNMHETLKRDILQKWATEVAKFSIQWREFSNKAKTNARWGISRKASEIADDWGYLAEFFSKDVTPDDREHLRNIVADIISRETVLKQQCEN